jgi:hypothetical protein
MRIKKVSTSLIQFASLSDAIKEELVENNSSGLKELHNGVLFWMKVPATVEEIEASPHWTEFCREQDFKAGDQILIEVFYKPVTVKITKTKRSQND